MTTLADGRVLVAGGYGFPTALTTSYVYGPGVRLNEIRVDQAGADNEEYIELTGRAGLRLTGLTILILGDSAASPSGVVEAAITLTGTHSPAIAAEGARWKRAMLRG